MTLVLQKGIDPYTNKIIWVMLDEDYQVVEPIQRYLTSLSATKSPNTVKAYGTDLKRWWEFLNHKCLDWRNVNLYQDLEDFAYWLRVGDPSKVISLQAVEAIRSEKSINRAITAVSTFYDHHLCNKTIDFSQFERFQAVYKTGNIRVGTTGILTGIAKAKPRREKLVKLKETTKFPGCLTDEQIETIVDACKHLRDKLMILMLNGTGMRKGELLGLKHEDVGDFGDYFVRVVRREDNPNGALAKGQDRTIPVTKELLQLYDEYLIREYPDKGSEFVFVNIWEGNIGAPVMLNLPNKILKNLEKKTGIKAYPHLFRHSYATRLLRANYSPERVKYLLGHGSIATTINIYSHIINEANLWEVMEKEEEE